MDTKTTLLAGGCGLVIGVLIGMALSASGRSVLEAQLAERGSAAEGLAKLEAAVGAVEARVGELGGRIGSVEDRVAALGQSHASQVAGLAERIDGVGAELAGAVSNVRTGVSAALSERIERLLARVEPGSAAPEPEAPAAAPEGEGELVRVGETVSFGDARVFLSAVNADAGRARVAINGAQTQVLELGTPVAAGDCTVMLAGFAEGGARIAGECATPPQGSGAGTAIAVGATGALADGRLRVFVSGIDARGGSARVAVNGTETIELRMSEPVRAGDCDVTLTGIGEGSVTIDAGC
jgi:hypothetical protein